MITIGALLICILIKVYKIYIEYFQGRNQLGHRKFEEGRSNNEALAQVGVERKTVRL